MKKLLIVALLIILSIASKAQSNTKDTTKQLKEIIIKNKSKGIDLLEMSTIRTEKITQKELKKNACCNLAESFESSPTVDVSYSNGLTGAKQIQMLGLNGNYVQMLTDLLPNARGLNYTYGFNNIPGTYVNTIFLNKGPGSVTNGFESMTGQIDVELQKPESAPKLHLNAYVNSRLRTELNVNTAKILNDKWSTMLMSHFSTIGNKVDMNKDNYMDRPMYTQVQGMNRWKYCSGNKLESMFGVKALYDKKVGGDIRYNQKMDRLAQPYFQFQNTMHRYEVFNKTSYSLNDCGSKSIGLQTNATLHNIDAIYGRNNYTASQKTFFLNTIYQTPIIDDHQELRTGGGILYDDIGETYKNIVLNRKEPVIGLFAEYTYRNEEKWSVLLGARTDYNARLKKQYFIPRANIKYSFSKHSVIRASAGSGFKTANIFAENNQLFSSNRNILITENLMPEYSWNYGLNYTYLFDKNNNEGRLSIDVFRTDFKNQVIVDFDQSPQTVVISNLHGQSFANYIQAELYYPLHKRVDIRLAYKYNEVKATQQGVLVEKVLNAKHRALFNAAYESRNKHWKADFTTQWIGQQRLPNTQSNPEIYRMQTMSPAFIKMLGQLTYSQPKYDIYMGSENMNNFTQKEIVLDGEHPYGNYFDAGNIWGPTLGRMFYAGFRYTLK